MRRRLLTAWAALVVVGWLVSLGAAEQPALNSAIRPVPREGAWWTQRHEAINARVKQGDAKLIFIGDSITQGWEGSGRRVWQRFYGPRNAVNLGISGDRTEHVLWRLAHGNLEGISPKLAVVMIGTNNSGANTPEQVADGIDAIVATLRAKLPETKVLLLAIFPRGANNDDRRRKAVGRINAIVARRAASAGIAYMDIGGRFLEPDGTLTRRVMPDLLHLSPAAYERWASAIEPFVARTLSGHSEAAADEDEAPDASDEGFVRLFDGRSLDGWRRAGGGASYTVEDGSIVGRVGPGRNTFLRTGKSYADFVLKLEVKLDVPVNSGIQIRSHETKDGRVFGYQCEIDPTARRWSGGIYDEGRRKWLFPLAGNEAARAAFKLDGWNEFVIKAVGPSIKTWVHGVQCARLIDDVDSEGFIALQVHAAPAGQVRWRNIRIKILSSGQ